MPTHPEWDKYKLFSSVSSHIPALTVRECNKRFTDYIKYHYIR